MFVSLEGGQGLCFCCPPYSCRGYPAHTWLLQAVAGAAEEGVGSRDPPRALSSGSERTCIFSGGQALLAGQAPAPCGAIWASGLPGKPGVGSGAVIYVAQPGCPWQAAPS